jgi:potassium-transporting ATPase KdpC subunit
MQHFRANLWLLLLSLVLSSVGYPLILLGIGQTFFRDKAQGSLIDKDGRPISRVEEAVGSLLIAQPFTGEEYFQPRPSAASYNAAASGASNWGANNPLLRDRVARQLGPIVKYSSGEKRGELVAPDVEAWFKQRPPGYVSQWAKDHSALAEQWLKDHIDSAARWLGKDAEGVKKDTADSSQTFFAEYSAKHPGTWPSEEEVKTPDGKSEKRIKPAQAGADVQAYLFDPWLGDHPNLDLEKVPADIVMASGSGLDPHITLKNALYQLDRVAAKWAEITKRDVPALRKEIEEMLRRKAAAPLGGLVGVDLVDVLEINLALRTAYTHPDK